MDSARTSKLTEIAFRNNLWCKNTGPWKDESGKMIPNRWERCDSSDPEAMLDLNAAAVFEYETDI